MNTPEKIRLESRPCPLGCGVEDVPVLVGGDRLHGLPGKFTVVRCTRCGLMRTNPRPTADSIGFYYPDEYGPYLATRVENTTNTGESSSAWRRRVKALFQFNTEHMPAKLSPGRLLEIGCASGAFMHRMAEVGWTVEGIEPSPAAGRATQSLGYPVHIGSLEEAPDPAAPFDLIVGWMVLEHLHKPVEAVRKLHRWTNPGGWFVLSVPNAGAAEFRIFKDAWYALQLPTHLFHYTPETISAVLQSGGWKVEQVHHQRTLTNLIASTGYRLRDWGHPDAMANALISYPERRGRKEYCLYPLSYLLSLLGQTGRMTVWARRADG